MNPSWNKNRTKILQALQSSMKKISKQLHIKSLKSISEGITIAPTHNVEVIGEEAAQHIQLAVSLFKHNQLHHR